MSGIGSLLDIGSWALFGNQSAIEATGNNIANVNTPGYSRRSVRRPPRSYAISTTSSRPSTIPSPP